MSVWTPFYRLGVTGVEERHVAKERTSGTPALLSPKVPDTGRRRDDHRGQVPDAALRRPQLTYIHQHFKRPDEAGGSRPYEFATRLSGMGWAVTVICAGAGQRTYEIGGVRVVQLDVPYANEMSFGRRIVAFLSFSARATVKAVTTPADVLFASSTPLTVAIPAMAAHLIRTFPMVFEVRDLWPEVPISLGALKNPLLIKAARLLARLTYRHSAAVVGLSPAMCAGVLRVTPQSTVHLIPNTAQPQRFFVADERRQAVRDALGLCCDDVLITYAGSLGRSYNSDWLLRLGASPSGRANGIKVLVVGGGAQYEELRRLARELGLDPDRTVLGPLPKTRVAEIYAASDLIASCLIDEPSLADNSLNKVFDAYAAGRPLVFNHGGWLAELTEREGAGWRLSADAGRASDQLSLLLASARLHAAGASSAALGISEFNVHHAAEALDDVLRRALDANIRR